MRAIALLCLSAALAIAQDADRDARIRQYFSNTLFAGIPDTPSLEPDLPVPMRGSDVFARSDPYRMAVINRAFPSPPPPRNIAVVNAASFRVEAPLAAGMLASLFGAASPGLFVLRSDDPTRPGAILNEDSTVNSAGNRARRGSVVQVFATGYGKDAGARAFLGETDAAILYSGLHGGLPGVWQLNVRVPAAADMANQIPLVIAAGGVVSNPLTLWVEE